MIYLLNGEDITGRQFEHNGAKYSPDWIKTATDGEIDEIGIVCLIEVHAALGPGQCEDGTFVDDMESKTRTYTVITKTKDQINAEINTEINLLQSRIDELTKLIQI